MCSNKPIRNGYHEKKVIRKENYTKVRQTLKDSIKFFAFLLLLSRKITFICWDLVAFCFEWRSLNFISTKTIQKCWHCYHKTIFAWIAYSKIRSNVQMMIFSLLSKTWIFVNSLPCLFLKLWDVQKCCLMIHSKLYEILTPRGFCLII